MQASPERIDLFCRRGLISVLSLILSFVTGNPGLIWGTDISRPFVRPASRENHKNQEPLLHGRVRQLRFGVGSSNELLLYAAGDDKVVHRWRLEPDASPEEIRFSPLSTGPARWPNKLEGVGRFDALTECRDHQGNVSLVMGGQGISESWIQMTDLKSGNEYLLSHPDDWRAFLTTLHYHRPSGLIISGYQQAQSSKDNSSNGQKGTFLIWKPRVNSPPELLEKQETSLTSIDFIAISPNGKQVIVGDRLGGKIQGFEASLFSASPDKTVFRPIWEDAFDIGFCGDVIHLSFVDEDRFLAVTRDQGFAECRLDSSTGKIIKKWTSPSAYLNLFGEPLTIKFSLFDSFPSDQEIKSSGWKFEQNLDPSNSYELAAPSVSGLWQSIRVLINQKAVRLGRIAPGSKLSLIRDSASRQLVFSSFNLLKAAVKHPRLDQVFLVSQIPVKENTGFNEKVKLLTSQERDLVALENSTFEGGVDALAISEDGQFLAAAGVAVPAKSRNSDANIQNWKRVIRLWRAKNGKLLAEYPDQDQVNGHPIAKVDLIQTSEDPSSLALSFEWQAAEGQASSAGNSRLFNMSGGLNGAMRHTRGGGIKPVSTSSHRFGMASQDQARLTRQYTNPLFGIPRCSTSFEIKDPSTKLLAVGYDYDIVLYELDSQRSPTKIFTRIRGFEGIPTCLSFSTIADRPWLMWGTEQGTIHIFSLDSKNAENPLGLRLENRSDGLFVVDASTDRAAYRYGLRAGDLITHWQTSLNHAVDLTQDVQQRVKLLNELSSNDYTKSWDLTVKKNGTSAKNIPSVFPVSEPTFSFYPVDNGAWVMWLPSGFCYASDRPENSPQWLEDGFAHIEWQINPDVSYLVDEAWSSDDSKPRKAVFDIAPTIAIPGAQNGKRSELSERFSRRRWFEELLKGDIEEFRRISRRDLAQEEQSFPTIKFRGLPDRGLNERDPELSLQIELSDNYRGDRKDCVSQVWLNCKRLETAPAVQKEGVDFLAVKIKPGELRTGSNTLICVAFGANQLPVCQQRVLRCQPEAKERRRPRLHYLGIGVTKFDRPPEERGKDLQELQYCGNDARKLRQALNAMGEAPGWQFEKGEQIVLTGDGDDPANFPTSERIRQALQMLEQAVRPDDLLCVLISAHGFMNKDENNFAKGFVVLTQDTRLENNEFQGLASSELLDRMSRINCAQWLILDTCYSGGAADSARELSRSGRYLGPLILSSTSSDAISYELKKSDNSAFTKALLDALESADRSKLSVAQISEQGVGQFALLEGEGKEGKTKAAGSVSVQRPQMFRSIGFPADGLPLTSRPNVK